MNAPSSSLDGSWLELVGAHETVLGPSRGHVPDIGAYRIAHLHLSPHALSLFGSVTGMPNEAESNGERPGIRKFNLALSIQVRTLLSITGQPEPDPKHDDSVHGFELSRPVAVTIAQTQELVFPDSKSKLLRVCGVSDHLRFDVLAQYVWAYGGKHAKKRFTGELYVPD